MTSLDITSPTHPPTHPPPPPPYPRFLPLFYSQNESEINKRHVANLHKSVSFSNRDIFSLWHSTLQQKSSTKNERSQFRRWQHSWPQRLTSLTRPSFQNTPEALPARNITFNFGGFGLQVRASVAGKALPVKQNVKKDVLNQSGPAWFYLV